VHDHSTPTPVSSRQFLSRRSTGSWIGGFGLPDSSTALGIDPEVRVPARKDFASELFCGKSRVAWITSNLTTAVADPTDNPNELGMRVTSKLLPLVDDAKRRTWIGVAQRFA
jgi:hypothetical protein